MRTSDGERSKKEGVFGSDAEVPMGEERCWRGCGNREVLVGRGLAWRPSKPARNREMRTDRRGEMSVEKANYAAAKIGVHLRRQTAPCQQGCGQLAEPLRPLLAVRP